MNGASKVFISCANNLDALNSRLLPLAARANKKATDEGSRNEVAIARNKAKALKEQIKSECKITIPTAFAAWRKSYARRLAELRDEISEVVKAAATVIPNTTALDAMCLARDIRDIIDETATIEAAFMSAVGKARSSQMRKPGGRVEA